MIWNFNDFHQFFIMTFASLIVVGFALNVYFLINGKNRLLPFLILYLYGVCFFFYIISTYLEIPDIRFIPPALVISIFAIVGLLNHLLTTEKMPVRLELFILVVLIAGSLIYSDDISPNARNWFRWNNTGYEVKKEYPNLQKIIKSFHGDISTGRIAWEKLTFRENTDFGSERAYENLYLFTGRPSMEGVHYSASFMARPTTYMQSEYSLSPVDPEPDRIYSSPNPEVWPFRFYQTNTKDIILFSDKIKSLFAESAYFEKTLDAGKWTVYSFKNFPKSYIEVTDLEKISILNESQGGFKADFYKFFRDYEIMDYPFVPRQFSKGLDGKVKSYGQYVDLKRDHYTTPDFSVWLTKRKYATSISDEKIDNFKISFLTNEVGKPHIIKITYSQNFKSRNGEKIYPIAPGYMMIIPQTSRVDIYYGWTSFEIAGLVLTGLLIVFLVFNKKIMTFVKIPFPKVLRISLISFFVVTVVFFFALCVFGSRKYKSDYANFQGLVYGNHRNLPLALSTVEKYATEANLDFYDNQVSFRYFLLKADILAKLGRKDEALQILDFLDFRYKHTLLNSDVHAAMMKIEKVN